MQHAHSSHYSNTLLIVDDKPENIGILFDFLKQQQFHVLVARDGEEGLEIAQQQKPDLILLDIMMPEMDGFKVCHIMQTDEQLKEIPIIFITALQEQEAKIKAFQMGGVDYIRKPFHQEEVLARVNTHLKLKQANLDLQTQNQINHEYSEMLEAQVKELEGLAHIVAQELKNPLIKASGMLQILQQQAQSSDLPYLEELNAIRQGMLYSVDFLLLLTEIRTLDVSMDVLDMRKTVAQVQRNMRYLLEKNQVQLQLPATLPNSIGYEPWITRIWEIYFNYVLSHSNAPVLELGATCDTQGYTRFYLKSRGLRLSARDKQGLFVGLEKVEDSYSLGFSIVRKITGKYGGEAGIDTLENQHGSLLYFSLPSA